MSHFYFVVTIGNGLTSIPSFTKTLGNQRANCNSKMAITPAILSAYPFFFPYLHSW